MNPRPGGGRKETTAATRRPVEKVKAPVETWRWLVFLVETPSDCCLLCCNPCSTFVVFPYSLPNRWYPPAFRHSASAASLVSSLAHQLDIGLVVLVIALSLPCACLVFCLIFLCPRSVGPSAGHIIGLIIPTNSNLVSSGLGLRPERMFVLFCFVLFCFLHLSFFFVLFFSFLFSSFFGCTCHGYVPDIIRLRVVRYGTPQLVSTVPFRTSTALHVLFCT